MTYRLRQLATGLLALAVAAAASQDARAQAQADPAAIVQSQEAQTAGLAAEWLASSDARTRAWGAYLALRDRRRELLPQLIGLAKVYPAKGGSQNVKEQDDRVAMTGVLDAIIQMNGRIDPEDAARLYQEFPVQSIILLSYGDPVADRFLLDIFRNDAFRKRNNKSNNTWLAAGNLLMSRNPSSGFAAAIFSGLSVHVSVSVRNPGGTAGPFGIGFSCPFSLPSPRTGWPAVGNYYTDTRGVLIANGADPSFYIRSVGDANPYGSRPDAREMPCFDVPDYWDTMREHFLANLVGESPGNSSVRSSVTKIIEWQNDAQYLRDLRTLMDQQKSLLEKLRGKLIDQGLLSAEEGASARPSLEMRIIDERSKRHSSLPVLQNLGNNVKVMN